MIFQTEQQLKEFGDKLSAGNKENIEGALEGLKKAFETKDVAAVQPALDKLNEAWKTASEELYKAQAEGGAQGGAQQAEPQGDGGQGGDNVQDVDFEEVK